MEAHPRFDGMSCFLLILERSYGDAQELIYIDDVGCSFFKNMILRTIAESARYCKICKCEKNGRMMVKERDL